MKQDKIDKTMKQYFMNLLGALIGRSPYQAELDGVKAELGKALAELDKLKEMYAQALAAWERSSRLVVEYERQTLSQRRTLSKKKLKSIWT